MVKNNIELFCGDCLDILPTIKDNSIDCVITSPPYDNIRTYGDTLEWDFDIFKKVAKELTRVIAKEEERSINYIVNKALKKFVEERKKNANS